MFEWLFAHALTSAELFFAGAWASIWHKGVGVGCIVVLVALALGSQMLGGIPMIGPFLADFFKPLRKDLLWAAFGVGLLVAGEFIGSIDKEKQCEAKTVVIENVVTKAVTKSKRPTTKLDKWDTDK